MFIRELCEFGICHGTVLHELGCRISPKDCSTAVVSAMVVSFALVQEDPASSDDFASSDSVEVLYFFRAQKAELHQKTLRVQQRRQRRRWSCHSLWAKTTQLLQKTLQVRPAELAYRRPAPVCSPRCAPGECSRTNRELLPVGPEKSKLWTTWPHGGRQQPLLKRHGLTPLNEYSSDRKDALGILGHCVYLCFCVFVGRSLFCVFCVFVCCCLCLMKVQLLLSFLLLSLLLLVSLVSCGPSRMFVVSHFCCTEDCCCFTSRQGLAPSSIHQEIRLTKFQKMFGKYWQDYSNAKNKPKTKNKGCHLSPMINLI